MVRAGHNCIFWPTELLAGKGARTGPEVILKRSSVHQKCWTLEKTFFAFSSSKTS